MMTDPFESFLALVGHYEVDPADAPAFARIAALCVSQTVRRLGEPRGLSIGVQL
jgi:hypothetical protein